MPATPDQLETAKRIADELDGIGHRPAGHLVGAPSHLHPCGLGCDDDLPRLHGPYWCWTREPHAEGTWRTLPREQAEVYGVWFENEEGLRALVDQGEVRGGSPRGLGRGRSVRVGHLGPGGSAAHHELDGLLLSTMSEVPALGQSHLQTPSALEPLGEKGVAEGRTISPPAAIADAVAAALGPAGLGIDVPPFARGNVAEVDRPPGGLGADEAVGR